jgi:putative acetyltransferase
MNLRHLISADHENVHEVVRAAFGNEDEARLVDLIRARDEVLLERVVIDEGQLIGHVLVSPISIQGYAEGCFAGLAPLSVLPEWQQHGVGSALMHEAIQVCKEQGIAALFLLGAPAYYRRFGFVTSHVGNEYGATDAFMHLELREGALADVDGVAKYVTAFNQSGV